MTTIDTNKSENDNWAWPKNLKEESDNITFLQSELDKCGKLNLANQNGIKFLVNYLDNKLDQYFGETAEPIDDPEEVMEVLVRAMEIAKGIEDQIETLHEELGVVDCISEDYGKYWEDQIRNGDIFEDEIKFIKKTLGTENLTDLENMTDYQKGIVARFAEDKRSFTCEQKQDVLDEDLPKEGTEEFEKLDEFQKKISKFVNA